MGASVSSDIQHQEKNKKCNAQWSTFFMKFEALPMKHFLSA